MSELAQHRLADLLGELSERCAAIQPVHENSNAILRIENQSIAFDVLTLLRQAAVHCKELKLDGEAEKLESHSASLRAILDEITMSLLVEESNDGVARERQAMREITLNGVIKVVLKFVRTFRRSLRKAISKGTTTSADVLTPPQVAKLLSVDPDTVRGWIKSRQLKAANVGKGGKRPRLKIRRADLETFLKNRQPEPTPEKRRRKREPEDVIQFIS